MSNCFLIAWCTVMRKVTVGTHWPGISGHFCESGSVRGETSYRKLPHGQSGSRRHWQIISASSRRRIKAPLGHSKPIGVLELWILL